MPLRRLPIPVPARAARTRLRGQVWPLLQTAGAAVGAWYLASLLLPDPRPSFAAIAAVIAVGATYRERPVRAVELTLGVVVGLLAADLLVHAIGTGPAVLGAAVSLALLVAVLMGGGPLFAAEAGVSAILVTTLPPSSAPIFPSRPLEALIGAGVALGVTAFAFPPDPRLHVARAADELLSELAAVLGSIADALAAGDSARAGDALQAARGLDRYTGALWDTLAIADETARLAPVRRRERADLQRYAAAAAHIDLAVRNARVLARHSHRVVRGATEAPGDLAPAVSELRFAVLELASELDGPERGSELRAHVARATALASAAYERDRNLGLAEVVVQVRSLAVDLLRASEAAMRTVTGPIAPPDAPTTEELLVGLPHAS
jgi:uncharacterized membrane protein YgaE (UPF0421/DUF939 family)